MEDRGLNADDSPFSLLMNRLFSKRNIVLVVGIVLLVVVVYLVNLFLFTASLTIKTNLEDGRLVIVPAGQPIDGPEEPLVATDINREATIRLSRGAYSVMVYGVGDSGNRNSATVGYAELDPRSDVELNLDVADFVNPRLIDEMSLISYPAFTDEVVVYKKDGLLGGYDLAQGNDYLYLSRFDSSLSANEAVEIKIEKLCGTNDGHSVAWINDGVYRIVNGRASLINEIKLPDFTTARTLPSKYMTCLSDAAVFGDGKLVDSSGLISVAETITDYTQFDGTKDNFVAYNDIDGYIIDHEHGIDEIEVEEEENLDTSFRWFREGPDVQPIVVDVGEIVNEVVVIDKEKLFISTDTRVLTYSNTAGDTELLSVQPLDVSIVSATPVTNGVVYAVPGSGLWLFDFESLTSRWLVDVSSVDIQTLASDGSGQVLYVSNLSSSSSSSGTDVLYLLDMTR